MQLSEQEIRSIVRCNIKALRRKYFLTYKHVALNLNIPLDRYKKIEEGACFPKPDVLKRLKDFYKVSYEDLLERRIEA